MGSRHVIHHGSFHGFFSERCLPEGIEDRQGSCVICHDRSHPAPHYRVTACAGAFIKKNKQKVKKKKHIPIALTGDKPGASAQPAPRTADGHSPCCIDRWE